MDFLDEKLHDKTIFWTKIDISLVGLKDFNLFPLK